MIILIRCIDCSGWSRFEYDGVSMLISYKKKCEHCNSRQFDLRSTISERTFSQVKIKKELLPTKTTLLE